MYAEHTLQVWYPAGLNNTKTDPANAVTVKLSGKHRWDGEEESITETKEQLKVRES